VTLFNGDVSKGVGMSGATTRLVFTLALLAVALAAGSPSPASTRHDTVVSPNPANFSPNIEDDAVVANAVVLALGKRRGTIYAGGNFRTVKNAARTETHIRHNLVAFSARTGAIRPLAPEFNGPVWALRATRSSLYVGGAFTTVNGISRRALVKLDRRTGEVDSTFNPAITSGRVTEVRLVERRLIVGGTFPKRLMALNRRTGANTGYIDLGINGSVATNAGPTEIYRFAVNPAGTRLVAIGNFTSVSGQPRRRAFMARLRETSATLSPWHSPALDLNCSGTGTPAYLRDVDFSPRGNYFVVVSAGFVPLRGDIGTSICDATARFNTADETSTAAPRWINYTGGDTLHSTAVTGAAVYVQGHQRWLDNPFGRNNAGPGAVSRPGIGAINPGTGKALSWNPTKTRGVGGKDFLATSAGLWVGSDGNRFANEFHASVAFAPLP
jgi:Domain of unknown function (DUF5122) beta-propeller